LACIVISVLLLVMMRFSKEKIRNELSQKILGNWFIDAFLFEFVMRRPELLGIKEKIFSRGTEIFIPMGESASFPSSALALGPEIADSSLKEIRS